VSAPNQTKGQTPDAHGPAASLQKAKQALRIALRQQRAAQTRTPAQAQLDAMQLADRVCSVPGFPLAGTVAIFAPLPDEIDPGPLGQRVRAAGGRLCYPRVHQKSPPQLTFHLCSEPELTPGGFGVREPASQLPQPAHIDAFIIPGLGFDRRGGRLGYGRGFYDAALRKQPAALRIAVGYDFQLQAAIPTGEQDEAVDFVVTPSERCTTAARTLPAPPNKEDSP